MIIGIWPRLSVRGRLFPWRHVVIVPCFNLHYLYSLIKLYRCDYENPSYFSPKERKMNGYINLILFPLLNCISAQN